jgi:hypothetical protein
MDVVFLLKDSIHEMRGIVNRIRIAADAIQDNARVSSELGSIADAIERCLDKQALVAEDIEDVFDEYDIDM